MVKCCNCGKVQYQTPPGVWYIDMFYNRECSQCRDTFVTCGNCFHTFIKCKNCLRDNKLEDILQF